ncbi:phosphoglycerate kinase [Candidatus Dojkabacteria bacterium]|uniref:Phosphoglycerate kinase n=1 Tax=Candidatus Dojkabacteria bacterium TaxID=2099670 RepID=A0A955L218_9BACT|nr:phosphoglycerate kinase [Candidatus Dojkabacteria bacterium]
MYNNIRKLSDANIKNKTVVVRVNFDVPINNGEITDNTRIASSVKTIEYLVNNNCKVVLISHMGRPEGEIVDDLSLMPARFELGKLLNKPIKFAHIDACENSIKFMEQGEILLLENLRFDKREESKKAKEREEFVQPLVDLCDVYINDSFGVYREHASVLELPKMLPSYAGFAMVKEIEALSKIDEEPESPYVAVIGGVKMDTKIPILKSLVKKVDTMLIGGAMAYTFLKAQGVEIGDSKFEKEHVKTAKEILKLAEKAKCEIILPIDHIAGKEFKENTKPIEIKTQQIPKGHWGLDIGPNTIKQFREIIESAKTILWNGPMGVFEWENFNKGTEAIGEYIALSTPKDAYKIAGGADTTYAMLKLRIKPKRFNHVSIGGGMMLNFLSGRKFKVLDVLCGEQNITQ